MLYQTYLSAPEVGKVCAALKGHISDEQTKLIHEQYVAILKYFEDVEKNNQSSFKKQTLVKLNKKKDEAQNFNSGGISCLNDLLYFVVSVVSFANYATKACKSSFDIQAYNDIVEQAPKGFDLKTLVRENKLTHHQPQTSEIKTKKVGRRKKDQQSPSQIPTECSKVDQGPKGLVKEKESTHHQPQTSEIKTNKAGEPEKLAKESLTENPPELVYKNQTSLTETDFSKAKIVFLPELAKCPQVPKSEWEKELPLLDDAFRQTLNTMANNVITNLYCKLITKVKEHYKSFYELNHISIALMKKVDNTAVEIAANLIKNVTFGQSNKTSNSSSSSEKSIADFSGNLRKDVQEFKPEQLVDVYNEPAKDSTETKMMSEEENAALGNACCWISPNESFNLNEFLGSPDTKKLLNDFFTNDNDDTSMKRSSDNQDGNQKPPKSMKQHHFNETKYDNDHFDLLEKLCNDNSPLTSCQPT